MKASDLTPEEARLVHLFRQLDARDQMIFMDVMADLVEIDKVIEFPKQEEVTQ